jgi:monosaccharide-transporting ATPase
MLLSMQNIDKSFSGVIALKKASLEIREGEVMALVGQNGAGKSTLIKILTGVYTKDNGLTKFDGSQVVFNSPAQSQAAGIATIYQEINLAPNRTVAENVFMSRELKKFGLLDRKSMRHQASEILKSFDLDIDVEKPIASFDAATRQLVAIARAVSQNARLVIMDEPTSSLDEREVETLFDTIRTLREKGVSILFIGHRLDELYAISDRVTIMRDGQTIGVHAMAEISKFELVRQMLGRELAAFEAAAQTENKRDRKICVEVKNLRAGRRVRDVTLDIAQGEITGLVGLLGSGRSETAHLIFGAEPKDSGTLKIKDVDCDYSSPAEAISDGIGFLAEDRKTDGIIPEMSIRENMTLAILPRLLKAGFVNQARQQEIVEKYIEALSIKCVSGDQPIQELSGGNQQKVLLARWLCMHPDILIVDEPTRGIDVGAKAEILKLLRSLADDGMSLLLISSELEELLSTADRISVLSDGLSVATFTSEQASQEKLFAAMAHQE